MRIAIGCDLTVYPDQMRQSFSDVWIEMAREIGHDVVVVDGLASDALQRIKGADAFIWRYSFFRPGAEAAPRLFDAVEDGLGIPVWPPRRSRVYFEDKIRESALLTALGMPHPRTWVFWRKDDALAAVGDIALPVVAKLSRGILGLGVVLLHTRSELYAHIARMFGHGAPRLGPPRSKLARLCGNAEWPIRAILQGAPSRQHEQGYVLLQEFIPRANGETRFCFVGDRMVCYRTLNRPDDFRASGSELFDRDPASVTPAALDLALRFRAAFGSAALVIDVMEPPEGPLIGEFSYTTSYFDVDACQSHWLLTPEGLVAVDRPLGYARAILHDFLIRSFGPEAVEHVAEIA